MNLSLIGRRLALYACPIAKLSARRITSDLKFKITGFIACPVRDTFEAVINPVASGGYQTTVTMEFELAGEGRTLVTITEQVWPETEKGLQASYSNCQGWAQMLCAMEPGSNLVSI